MILVFLFGECEATLPCFVRDQHFPSPGEDSRTTCKLGNFTERANDINSSKVFMSILKRAY